MRIMLCASGRSPHAVRWANALVDRSHEVALVSAPTDLPAPEMSGFRPSIWQHHHVSRRAARVLAARFQPDLVHGFYLSSNGLLAHATGVRPLVLSALGSDVKDLSGAFGNGVRRRMEDAYVARLTRAAVVSADVVLADSNAIAQAVRQRVPKTQTRIIRFGVEIDGLPGSAARAMWRRRLGIDQGALVLLSSRLIRPHYNIETIIRALRAVRDRIPNTILVLKELESFTDPEYRRHCQELVNELDLSGAVRTVGDLDRGELLELHAAADIYVSVPTTDGTSVSVLEAMAAAVAVVASDVPGIDRAILRDDATALLVPPADAESLASAVIALGVDPHRRRALAERARDVVRIHGDFDRELDRCVLLYEELVRGSRS